MVRCSSKTWLVISYQIEITPLAIKLLAKIKYRREQTGIKQRINKLKSEPDKQGKAISGKLKGDRNVRALGQRYRIVYKVDRFKVTVIVVGAGIRKDGSKKDIYAILNKFFYRPIILINLINIVLLCS